MEQTLAGLGSRVFLMNNVHEDQPVVFETRWALSYLRGPLGRQEIKRLMDPIKSARQARLSRSRAESVEAARQSAPTRQSEAALQSGPSRTVSTDPAATVGRPRRSRPASISTSCRCAAGRLPARGSSTRRCCSASPRCASPTRRPGWTPPQTVTVTTPVSDAPVPVDWNAAAESAFGPSDLEREAGAGAAYDPLPSAASKAKSYDAWKKSFGTWVYGAKKLELLRSAEPPLVSQPGETEGQFRVRLQQAARESRDEAVERLRQQYAPKIATLQERLRRAQAARGARGQPGIVCEAADSHLVRRDAARRVHGAQGGEHVHGRACDDGGAGRRAVDEGGRGREARGRERGVGAAADRRARSRTARADRGRRGEDGERARWSR